MYAILELNSNYFVNTLRLISGLFRATRYTKIWSKILQNEISTKNGSKAKIEARVDWERCRWSVANKQL
jgi:hypothetical protein